MALRDLPVNVAEMKGKLFDTSTCGKRCNTRSECQEGFICSNCVTFANLFSQCV
uniref:HR7 protein n=2 Tax=Solanum TaxID=4107 RepID=M1A255_SOLTU